MRRGCCAEVDASVQQLPPEVTSQRTKTSANAINFLTCTSIELVELKKLIIYDCGKLVKMLLYRWPIL